MTTRYYNEMNDEISEEEFNSPQYHEPADTTDYSTTDGYYGLSESNEIWNRKMDKESDAFYSGRNDGNTYSGLSKTAKGTSGSRTVGGGTRSATSGAGYTQIGYTQIGALPELTYDKFTSPERDENRVSQLRMKASGAGLRELRRQTQSTIASASGLDPTMRRMTLKDALMGYGSGVSKVMSQADQIAQRQYEKEYDDKFKESTMNYQAGINKANLEYKSKIEKLLFNAQHPSMAQINANERALAAGSTGMGQFWTGNWR
jgi:hypothetical protein